MAALLKRQQLQQQQGKITQVQVPAQAGIGATQIYTQTATGIHVQQAGTSGTTSIPMTLVKTSGTVTGVRGATQQQIRQVVGQQIIAQRRLPTGQKVAQIAQVGKGGVPTQLIVQQKGGLQGTMMMQQLQQVMKQVPGTSIQQFTHVSILISVNAIFSINIAVITIFILIILLLFNVTGLGRTSGRAARASRLSKVTNSNASYSCVVWSAQTNDSSCYGKYCTAATASNARKTCRHDSESEPRTKYS